MKILFINPPLVKATKERLGPVIESLFYNSPPLGLCYLAGVLEKGNHKVKIIDAPVLHLSYSQILERIKKFSPDLIGIASFTVSFYSCFKLTQEIKNKFPNIKIIIGGPHITSNPQELLEHSEFDIGVLGEGELTIRELVEAFEKGRDLREIKGLAYVEDSKVILTKKRSYISNLDVLPFPARHLIPVELYKPQPNDQKRLPKFSMITSRGCPYSCIFCDKSVFRNIYRSFSPEYIVREMKHLVEEYRARDIAFVDSTFTPDRKRVYTIINEIKKANLDVTWTCSVRANILDFELLKEMKQAGCWRVRVGVESGDEDILKFIKKGITRAQVRKTVSWAYDLNLEPKAFFMLGHLIDTKETIKETIDFACSLPLKDITVQINTPLKNTAQYKLVSKYGRLVTKDYSEYSFWEPVFIPNGLSYQELTSYYRKFYLKFYLRPKVWYRHIIKIRRLSDIIKYLRGIRILIYFFNLCWKKKF